MSRDKLQTELRILMRRQAARFVDELDLSNLQAAKHRLQHMLSLMEIVMPHDHYEGVKE